MIHPPAEQSLREDFFSLRYKMSLFNRITQNCPHPEKEEKILWLLHRITGIGMFLFLTLHVVHIWLMGYGPEPFNTFIEIFRHPVARLLHIFLFFSVLFHATNGVRVTLLDFWPALRPYKKQSVSVAVVIFLLIFIPSALLISMDAFLP